MLESLYLTLFRPGTAAQPLRLGGAWGLWLILAILAALPAAGQWGLGTPGLIGLSTLLFVMLVLGWFGMGALAHLLAELLGGQGDGRAALTAIAAAFWPSVLIAPLEVAAPVLGRFGALLRFLVWLWVVLGLVRAIARSQQLPWGRAALCLVVSGAIAMAGVISAVLAPVVALAIMLT